jgi:hypothetical protein
MDILEISIAPSNGHALKLAVLTHAGIGDNA